MKHIVVPIKNIGLLNEAGSALLDREPGSPGLGVIFGAPGIGKTTAVTWYTNKCHGVYVRALATWTPSSMCQAICDELDIPYKRGIGNMVKSIIEKLTIDNRPLFIDEADYIVSQKAVIETLRDLHDLAKVPVIIIGMKDLTRGLKRFPQFESRVMEWVEFMPADVEDCQLMVRVLTDINICDDLAHELFKRSKGVVRRIIVGLTQIEKFAKNKVLQEVTLSDWHQGKKEFFLGG